MEFLETFRKFFHNYVQGTVSVRDSTGAVQRLRHGDSNVRQLAQKAVEFRCEERWHSRAAFASLMHKRMQPGNAFQISAEECFIIKM
jgi:hypothetical protein